MFNKNYYLKKFVISTVLTALTLIMVYYRNTRHYPIFTFLESNKILVINQKLNKLKSKIFDNLDSLMHATKYKQELLKCQSSLKQNQICSNTLYGQNNLRILAINWPDIGYITTNNPKGTITNGLLVDSYNNFLGTIVNSTETILIVRTIHSNNFKIAVYLENAHAYGLLINQSGQLLVTQINIKHNIKKDDNIYLLDKSYPTNIKIGKVKKILSNTSSPFTTVIVEPVYKNLDEITPAVALKIIEPQNAPNK